MNLGVHFRSGDLDIARLLVERVDKLHTDRIGASAAGDQRAAVRDAILITDLLDHAPASVLRAAVMLLSTPELRMVPVVLGPHDVPVGPRPNFPDAGGVR